MTYTMPVNVVTVSRLASLGKMEDGVASSLLACPVCTEQSYAIELCPVGPDLGNEMPGASRDYSLPHKPLALMALPGPNPLPGSPSAGSSCASDSTVTLAGLQSAVPSGHLGGDH